MDLYVEILVKALENEKIQLSFPQLDLNVTEIIENECYSAMQQIKEILCDESLNDSECFKKIECIIQLFEDIGSNGGARHDF